MVTDGLSLATSGTCPEYHDLAQTFGEISNKQNQQPGKAQIFTVEVKAIPDLKYRYRYLLASHTNLLAYWRVRFGSEGSVPRHLCQLLPLASREIQELESADSRIRVKWDASKWFPDQTLALRAIYAFSSVAQIDFYLKAALLY